MYKFIKYSLLSLLLLGSLPTFTKNSLFENQNNNLTYISNEELILVAKMLVSILDKVDKKDFSDVIKKFDKINQQRKNIVANKIHSQEIAVPYAMLKKVTQEITVRIKHCTQDSELNTLISLKSEIENFLDFIEKVHNKCCNLNCYSKN